MNRISILLLPALLAGCATTAKTPDWVSGPAKAYPASQYLTGRGDAASVEQAQDRARADLAKIFEVAVSAESEDVQTFKRSGGEGSETPGQYEQSVQRRLQTRTDKIVSGIRIADLWRDPVSGMHHALAVLSRAQAGASLRQEIGALDEATRRYLEQSRQAPDALLKIGAAGRALDAQLERDGLQKTLKVVDITGHGVEPEWSSARLRADLDELLKRLRVAVQIAPDSPAGFPVVVGGALTHAGFLADTADNPPYVLEAQLQAEDLGQRDGWYWQRGTLVVTLRDTASQRERGSRRWALKASAQERATAQQRLLKEADAVLKKELRATVIGFAGAER
jgi:hypothetical protein